MTTLSQTQVPSPQAARRTALLIAVIALVVALISLVVSVSQRGSSAAAPAARPALATSTTAVVPGGPADAAAKHAAVVRAQKAAESDAVHVRSASPREDEAAENAILAQVKATKPA